MSRHIVGMALWFAGVCAGLALIVQGFTGWSDGTPWDSVLGASFALIFGSRFVSDLRDARAKRSGERPPIVLARPDASFLGMDFEGGAFDDPGAPGWQVVPYSTARAWPCGIADADTVLFRGAPGIISFAESRRMAAALVATADYAEAAQKGGRS